MTAYFKPLRRKIGGVTLVVACVFGAGWVRSCRLDDAIRFNWRERRQLARSAEGDLSWHSWKRRQNDSLASWKTFPIWRPPSERPPARNSWDRIAEWSVPHADLMHVRMQDDVDGLKYARWICPYWRIVIPLTAISAWLLLSKSGAKQEPPITPASENV